MKKAVGKQAEKLRREMDRLETQFIRDNYDNPLGPGMFVWLFSENPVPVRILGIPDENVVHGTNKEIFAHYGLDADGIVKAANDFLKK